MSATLTDLTEEELDELRACLWKASRVNFDSMHRIELRKILCRHDLEVAEIVLAAAKLNPPKDTA